MKISLFGYGKTNKALAKRLAPCDIYDDSFSEESSDYYGNRLLNPACFKPEVSDLEITTPGIPPSNKLIKQAKNLVSEYDIFATSMPYSIWISGTNGKTTTTEMLQHLLSPHGSVYGGNIGIPLAELDEQAKIWILETSSFTLHYTRFAHPNLYLLLPISEDHISWHGSYKAYIESKLKPLRMMRDKEIAIVPKRFLDTATNCELIGYNDSFELAKTMGIDTEKITLKEPFLLDAILALSTYKILFGEIPYEHMSNFKIGAHKLEEFFDTHGRLWVDDSKATNIDASIAALKRYRDKRIHIILGGDDKGAELVPLFDFLKSLNVIVYAIGSNTQRISTLCDATMISHQVCEVLENAVEKIKKNLKPGEVALLSPAAASLDQFSSYKERGELFQKYALS
ncbi:MAG: UDP-N-acetylmuramoyl-L-alanine--D-glutamate ligase [Wolinella sp.]